MIIKSPLSATQVLSPFFPNGFPHNVQAAGPEIDDFFSALATAGPSASSAELHDAASLYEAAPNPDTRGLLLGHMAKDCEMLNQDQLEKARQVMGLPRRISYETPGRIAENHPTAAQLGLVTRLESGRFSVDGVTPALFYRVGDLFRTKQAGIILVQKDGSEVFARKKDWLRLRWSPVYYNYNHSDFADYYEWQATVVENDPDTDMPVGFIRPEVVGLILPVVDLKNPDLRSKSIKRVPV